MHKKIFFWAWHKRYEIALVSVLLIISGLAHAYNMFHFPYYENDEGSYSSYAWAFLTKGKLSPYTYWYDHAPLGWILIAGWAALTGGFSTFGFAINSGRVLMLIIHIASTFFLYLIGKRLSNSKFVGFFAGIIFSLSPLGIYFQRRVLLDNIMVFWILISLIFLINKKKLRYIIFSAITFAIAVLTKENAIFYLPVFLYMIYVLAHKTNRRFAIIQWLTIVLLIISLYFIYAFVKNELFPFGTLLGGNSPHVSLIDAVKFQMSRSGGNFLDFKQSAFWQNFQIWVNEDPVIIYFGIAATLLNLIIGIKYQAARFASLLALAMWYFLARGGMVIEFYILPLLPLLALNIALLVQYFQKIIEKLLRSIRISSTYNFPLALSTILIAVLSLENSTHVRTHLNLYKSDQTTQQINAVNWILSKDIPDAVYIIDNYAYIDLHNKNYKNFKNVEWYWKTDKDPDIKNKLLQQNPDNIFYIGVTPQMRDDIIASGLSFTQTALNNSRPVTSFYGDLWGVDYWAVNTPKRILSSSWESYKMHFIKNGRVINPYEKYSTTSEGQSYALLRAVWMNDKKTFDSVLSWSQKNIQLNNYLFAWRKNSDGTYDTPSTDADQDIALSLLFAYKKWGNEKYLADAKNIINGIWKKDVISIQNKPYITAGDWANNLTSYTINPSYISPAHYKIFSKVDNSHDWKTLADTSYEILQKCTSANLDKFKGLLPPEWCAINKNSITATQPIKPHPSSTEYSHNAIRVPWRIGLDYQWFKDDRAKKYLSTLYLNQLFQTNGKLVNAYQHDGAIWENYESVSAYAGDIGYFITLDPKTAEIIYKNKILKKFYENRDNSYWDDPKNYYTQNWGWFGTALYSKRLPNLWEIKNTSGNNTLVKN